MRVHSVLAMALSSILSGCGDGASANEGRAADAAFTAFQGALQRGDREACRALLTGESQAALAEMPWDDIAKKAPLTVLGVDGGGAEYRVRVQDPNDGGRAAEFVVVREYGRFVVDLVASAGLTARTVEATGGHEEFVPRELTPADLDRIRQHELAQPPR